MFHEVHTGIFLYFACLGKNNSLNVEIANKVVYNLTLTLFCLESHSLFLLGSNDWLTFYPKTTLLSSLFSFMNFLFSIYVIAVKINMFFRAGHILSYSNY